MLSLFAALLVLSGVVTASHRSSRYRYRHVDYCHKYSLDTMDKVYMTDIAGTYMRLENLMLIGSSDETENSRITDYTEFVEEHFDEDAVIFFDDDAGILLHYILLLRCVFCPH